MVFDTGQPALYLRAMKIRAISCWFLLAAMSAWAQPQLQPLNSFWYADTNDLSSNRMTLLSTTLPGWLNARVFDGFMWHILPPTFTDPQPVIALMNSLNGLLGGKGITVTLPVGTV